MPSQINATFPPCLMPNMPPSYLSISLLGLIEDVSQVAFPAVLSVMHGSHEDTSAAVLGRALSPQSLDLPISVDLVVLEHGQLGLLALVLDLLRGGVHLLLALLGSTAQTQDQVEGAFLLDVVVAEGSAVFKLLAGEDQSLLVGGDAFLVFARLVVVDSEQRGEVILTLDLGLDIVDGIGGFNLEGDGLTREGLDEDLHDEDLEMKATVSSLVWIVA
jgi:hypothetical protein